MSSPSPDALEEECRRSPQPGRVEVLMDDGVPPDIQVLQRLFPYEIPGVEGLDLGPKINAQPAEIGADACRLRIASIQLAALEEFGPYHRLEPGRTHRA